MSGVFDRRPDVAASGDEAVAAGRDIGTAVTAPGAIGTQNIGSVTVLGAPGLPDGLPRAASVAAPRGLTNLPERPRLFVGRRRELALLQDVVGTGGGSMIQVLHGLGGVGKSTLAAHWAVEHARYAPVWWVPGDSRVSIDAGLASLAAAVEPSLTSFLQQSQLRDWALQWLAGHDDWLIVVDNVADPGDVKPLLAAVTGGRFLITSRRATGWHGIAEAISLDVLALDEAIDLFTRICPDAGDGAGALCAELGHLPLAIDQAAAYCLETGTTADEYQELLADYPVDMYTAAIEGGDIERTMARVWRVSLDRLADDPLAVVILLTLAWYAPDDIPRSLLDILGTPPAVRRAVGRLAAHSMVTLRDMSSLSMHRLVQAVSRTSDPGDPHRSAEAVGRAREIAAECLIEAVPADSNDPLDWPVWRRLLPHVEALAQHADPGADSVELSRVFSRMGEFIGKQMVSDRARRLLARGESGLVRLLGADHPLTLAARNRVVTQGPPPLKQALQHLARCERALGSRHPETITALYELAGSHLREGNREKALQVLERVVMTRGRILGPWHPDTLHARWSIAVLRVMSGDIVGSTEMLEQLRDDCVRELGERHPLTLDVRRLANQVTGSMTTGLSHIASLMMALPGGENLEQRIEQLQAEFERARDEVDPQAVRAWASQSLVESKRHLEDCEVVLGREHGDTIMARIGLSQMYMLVDDLDNALRHAREAVADAEHHLGNDTVATASARMILLCLAVAVDDNSTVQRSVEWFQRAIQRQAGGGEREFYATPAQRVLEGFEPLRRYFAITTLEGSPSLTEPLEPKRSDE